MGNGNSSKTENSAIKMGEEPDFARLSCPPPIIPEQDIAGLWEQKAETFLPRKAHMHIERCQVAIARDGRCCVLSEEMGEVAGGVSFGKRILTKGQVNDYYYDGCYDLYMSTSTEQDLVDHYKIEER